MWHNQQYESSKAFRSVGTLFVNILDTFSALFSRLIIFQSKIAAQYRWRTSGIGLIRLHHRDGNSAAATLDKGARVSYNIGGGNTKGPEAINVAAASDARDLGMDIMGDGIGSAFALPVPVIQPAFPFEPAAAAPVDLGPGAARSVFADYKPFAPPPAAAPAAPRAAHASPPRASPPRMADASPPRLAPPPDPNAHGPPPLARSRAGAPWPVRPAPAPVDPGEPLECPLTHANLRTTTVKKLTERILASDWCRRRRRRRARAAAARMSRTP